MVEKEHFDLVAVDYDSQASRGLWGWLKAKEVAAVLQEISSTTGPKSILDLGCGTGIYANEVHSRFPDCKIVGLDKSQAMLQQFGKRGFTGNHINLEQKSFSGGKFEVILGLGVFEFVRDLTPIRETIQNSAEKNTRVFVLVPRFNILNLFYFFYHRLKGNRVNVRSFHEYRKIFHKDGFDLVKYINVTPVSRFLVFRK